MASVPMEKILYHKKTFSGKKYERKKPKQKCTETSQQTKNVHAEVV